MTIPHASGLFVPPAKAARWLVREAEADNRAVRMAILLAAQCGATARERTLIHLIGNETRKFLLGLAEAVS